MDRRRSSNNNFKKKEVSVCWFHRTGKSLIETKKQFACISMGKLGKPKERGCFTGSALRGMTVATSTWSFSMGPYMGMYALQKSKGPLKKVRDRIKGPC